MEEIILVMLGICSVFDVHIKSIPKGLLYCFTIMQFGYLLMNAEVLSWNCMLGIVSGAAVWVMSKITRNGIGIGDAWILIITGSALGWMYNVTILFVAMLLAMIAGLFLVVCKKQSIQRELPFVPFLLVAYGLFLCRGYGCV